LASATSRLGKELRKSRFCFGQRTHDLLIIYLLTTNKEWEISYSLCGRVALAREAFHTSNCRAGKWASFISVLKKRDGE
jgi:hypothetical protein